VEGSVHPESGNDSVVNRLGLIGRRMKTVASLAPAAGLTAAAAIGAPATAAAAAGQAVESRTDGVGRLAREVRRQVGKLLDAELPEGLRVVEGGDSLEARRVASLRLDDFVRRRRLVDLNVDAVLAGHGEHGCGVDDGAEILLSNTETCS